MIVFGTVTRIINAKFLIRTQHKSRIMFGASIGMTSFIVISICCAYKQIPAMFYISLVSAILMGVQSALGESTTLGFLKSFPGDSVGFYGSGTGFAGIFASGTLILLKSLNF